MTMRSLFKALKFEPHSDAQWDYCESGARFAVPCCGRRWGKSIATGHKFTYKAFKADSYNWIVGPTYKLGEKEFRVFWRDLEKLNLLKHCKRKQYSVNQGNMRVELPWGAVCEVVSSEKPDSLLGEGLDHAVMSEAAKNNRMVWEQYIEPALSDKRGSADFPSTPQGFNWYHGLYTLGQDPSMTDYKSWSFPTWTNKARYPLGLKEYELIRIKSTVSKVYWEQEYAAMFTSMAGAIYDEWDDRVHLKEHTFVPAWANYLGFDFGFSNPFVALDMQVGPDDTVYFWREYYERFQSTWDHGQNLLKRDNPPGYHIDGMWGDPRGADAIATLSGILGFVASQDVPYGHSIEAIKRMLKVDDTGSAHFYVDPVGCPNLARQMRQLHVKEASRQSKQDLNESQGDGNIQHKVDDHAADAARYIIGPLYVLGAGTHLEDIHGSVYSGSESEDFLRLHSTSPFTLGGSGVHL